MCRARGAGDDVGILGPQRQQCVPEGVGRLGVEAASRDRVEEVGGRLDALAVGGVGVLGGQVDPVVVQRFVGEGVDGRAAAAHADEPLRHPLVRGRGWRLGRPRLAVVTQRDRLPLGADRRLTPVVDQAAVDEHQVGDPLGHRRGVGPAVVVVVVELVREHGDLRSEGMGRPRWHGPRPSGVRHPQGRLSAPRRRSAGPASPPRWPASRRPPGATRASGRRTPRAPARCRCRPRCSRPRCRRGHPRCPRRTA